MNLVTWKHISLINVYVSLHPVTTVDIHARIITIFFVCPAINIYILTLYDNVLGITNLSTNSLNELLHILLFGNKSLSYETNCQIFKAVQSYIQSTKRF